VPAQEASSIALEVVDVDPEEGDLTSVRVGGGAT